MITIEVTEAERSSQGLSESHREQAVNAILQDGFVVLKDVVSDESIRTLREKMLQDLEQLLAREDTPYNFNTGNIQQEAPPFAPYLFRDILLNDQVIALTHSLLGPGVKNAYYSGNTAMPSDQRQPVHPDVGHLWSNIPIATPTFGVVVNIPLVDVSAENGSTEIWPGSHLDSSISIHQDIKVPTERLERRRAYAPPIQPTISTGSVLIRDIRLWHAGMPNRTQSPRPMLAMIHWCGWFVGEKLKFPKASEEFFKHPILHTNADFVDEPIDYIHSPQAYDFKKEDQAS